MLFRKRQDLIVIKTDKKMNSYAIKDIIDAIDKPVCNVYFENQGKIYGIVNTFYRRKRDNRNTKRFQVFNIYELY